MRVRTEARRRAILDAARSVFEERGFERATMAEISERVGGSKMTLYSYFPSKEELFVACIEEDIEADAGQMVEAVRAIPDLYQSLETFGRIYLATATGPRAIANYRMLAGMPPETGLGRRFYDFMRRGWLKLCHHFEEQIAAGRLRPEAPWTMAMHLKGMLEAEHFDRRLLNDEPELDAATLEQTARNAAKAFVRLYGTEAG